MESGGHELLINVGVAGNSDAFRRSGWSQPEPRHPWTIGRESTLELPRPTTPGTYRMVIELGPFVWKDRLPQQHLSVLVNDTEVDEFELREIGLVECTVPWSILEGRQTVSVRFIHPDAAKPSDVKGVPDHREIALAFEQLYFFHRFDEDADRDESTVSGRRANIGFASPDQLMMQFESLGENCEFGLAQRRCGAEPLGLLRFASAPIEKLLAALEDRFEGMGEADQVEVRASEDQSEYLVVHRRFGFLYHPWVLVGDAEPEYIRRRETTRLPFLRRKLLEDLEEGRKIFVYHGMRRLSESEALRLLTAIRGYGPGTLLWVELHDATHRPGSVEAIRPGLFKAYIDRFAPSENAHDLSLDCWIEICRNAYRVIHDEMTETRQGQRSSGRPSPWTG
jgi:hypothetical protein